MKIEEIATLFDYSCWATEKIVAETAKLDPDQVIAPIPCSHGSLRGTIAHMISAEWIWRLRCQKGISPDRLIDAKQFPTFESLRLRLEEEQAEMKNYLNSLGSDDLQNAIEYKTTKGATHKNVLWHILMHLFNHGTHHRSEAAEILTRYGHSPGDLDFILYLRDIIQTDSP